MKAGESMQIPIFNSEYSVIVTWGTPKEIGKTLKYWGYPKDDARTLPKEASNNRGSTYINDGCHPVIAMPSPPKKPDEIGTLAHEACHAIEAIFTKIGQPLGDEVFAHSVGAVVKAVLKHNKK